MSHPGRKGRVTREQWLATALDALQEEGPDAINIQALSRRLKISKTSFYWHFKDRSELIDALIDYWKHELTEVVTKNHQIIDAAAKERLVLAAQIIDDYNLAQYDMVFRLWAKSEPRVREALKNVNQERTEFVRSALEELGHTGLDLEMRTALFVCYQTAEQFILPELPKAKRESLRRKRLDLILG